MRMFPAFQPDERQAVVYEHIPNRPYDEQHRETPINHVLEFAHAAKRIKFFDGQQLDVADVAVFPQDTVVAVVEIVAFGPIAIGNETEVTAHLADDVVGLARGRKRLVAAVVLYDEDAHKKKRIDDRKPKGEPQRYVAQPIHRYPNGHEWQERIDDLNGRFFLVGKLVRLDDLRELLEDTDFYWRILHCVQFCIKNRKLGYLGVKKGFFFPKRHQGRAIL